MRRTTVAIVDVIRVLPDIHRQKRFETFGDRIAGIGFLGDDEFAILVRCQPNPTSTEERGAFLLKLRFEGFKRAEITDNGLDYR